MTLFLVVGFVYFDLVFGFEIQIYECLMFLS